MIIAIAEWNGRISPVFDVTENVKLYKLENGNYEFSKNLNLGNSEGERRIELIKNSGVQLLLCGAMSGYLEHLAILQGIEVIPFLSGNAERIINDFAGGNWQIQSHRMPGCRGRRNHRGGRCGQGRGRRRNI